MVPYRLESHGCGLCLSWLALGLQPEWIQVYKLCRVRTTCIAAYSVMYISLSGFTFRVVLLDLYLPLVYLPTWIAVEVRGVGVLVPPWWVRLSWKVCVDREFGMPKCSVSGVLPDALNLLLLHRKTPALSLDTFLTLAST